MDLRAIAGLTLGVALAGAASAAESAKPPQSSICVDVQIGNERATDLECLNESFRHVVEKEHAAPPIEAPIDTHSAPTQVGTFNEAAAREHMGNALGVSSIPQRPPKPVFSNPLIPPSAH